MRVVLFYMCRAVEELRSHGWQARGLGLDLKQLPIGRGL